VDLYTLTLPLDAWSAARLRAWLTTVFEGDALARSSSPEIILATTEALNSALRNSLPDGTKVVIGTISIVGHDVYIRVSDRDQGAWPPLDPETNVERDVSDELGLTLMNGLMDSVNWHQADDGTTVRLVKRLRLPLDGLPDSSAAAPSSPAA